MTTTNDGGAAFPGGMLPAGYEAEGDPINDGMSLRDYFAGQAMKGMLSNVEAVKRGWNSPDTVAHWAGKFADAMLAEKKRRDSEKGLDPAVETG